MNRIELNKIINVIVPATDQHTVMIDQMTLNFRNVELELIHSDEGGTIENETIKVEINGTITRNGSLITASDLLELPLAIREVLAMLIVAMRDVSFDGDNPELELISANKEFFLARQEAFVPAGLLEAAGIVDEHNMAID